MKKLFLLLALSIPSLAQNWQVGAPNNPVISISVAPAGAVVGGNVQMVGTGATAGSSSLVTLPPPPSPGACVWTSANPSVASINPSGVALGLNAGTSLITCTSNGLSGSALLTIGNVPQIINPNSISCSQPCVLPNAIESAAYTFGFAATGGNPPYTWSVSSGSLPSGWTSAATLNASTGVLSGTPNAATATTLFTIQVTDSQSNVTSLPVSLSVISGGSNCGFPNFVCSNTSQALLDLPSGYLSSLAGFSGSAATPATDTSLNSGTIVRCTDGNMFTGSQVGDSFQGAVGDSAEAQAWSIDHQLLLVQDSNGGYTPLVFNGFGVATGLACSRLYASNPTYSSTGGLGRLGPMQYSPTNSRWLYVHTSTLSTILQLYNLSNYTNPAASPTIATVVDFSEGFTPGYATGGTGGAIKYAEFGGIANDSGSQAISCGDFSNNTGGQGTGGLVVCAVFNPTAILAGSGSINNNIYYTMDLIAGQNYVTTFNGSAWVQSPVGPIVGEHPLIHNMRINRNGQWSLISKEGNSCGGGTCTGSYYDIAAPGTPLTSTSITSMNCTVSGCTASVASSAGFQVGDVSLVAGNTNSRINSGTYTVVSTGVGSITFNGLVGAPTSGTGGTLTDQNFANILWEMCSIANPCGHEAQGFNLMFGFGGPYTFAYGQTLPTRTQIYVREPFCNGNYPAYTNVPCQTLNLDTHLNSDLDNPSDTGFVIQSTTSTDLPPVKTTASGPAPPNLETNIGAWRNEVIGINPVDGTLHRFWHTGDTTTGPFGIYILAVPSKDGAAIMFTTDAQGQFGLVNSSGTNTCVAATDYWRSATSYPVNTNVLPISSNNNPGSFIYSSNGGVTGPSIPVMNQTVGSTTTDGTMTWTNQGQYSCRYDVLIGQPQ